MYSSQFKLFLFPPQFKLSLFPLYWYNVDVFINVNSKDVTLWDRYLYAGRPWAWRGTCSGPSGCMKLVVYPDP